MPDPRNDARHACDDGWHAAFASLPAETPPADGWSRVANALDRTGAGVSRGRRWQRFAGGLALAATLALAVALPWRAAHEDGVPADTAATVLPDTPPADTPDTLDALYAESARLEALLGHARDGRVGSGAAMAMSADLEARLAAIDTALADPRLPPDRWETLWRERVDALEALVGVEGTRRWLAANGAQSDGALVQVN